LGPIVAATVGTGVTVRRRSCPLDALAPPVLDPEYRVAEQGDTRGSVRHALRDVYICQKKSRRGSRSSRMLQHEVVVRVARPGEHGEGDSVQSVFRNEDQAPGCQPLAQR